MSGRGTFVELWIFYWLYIEDERQRDYLILHDTDITLPHFAALNNTNVLFLGFCRSEVLVDLTGSSA